MLSTITRHRTLGVIISMIACNCFQKVINTKSNPWQIAKRFTAFIKNHNNNNIDKDKDSYSGVNKPTISWYPGHIAKAERELAEYLKKVDVVIEVRDARIPFATTHPMVPEWVGNRPLIVAIARLDLVPKQALADWREYYTLNPAHPNRPDAKIYFVDGKLGAGVLTVKKQALKSSETVNSRRRKRGIQPRAVRAAVIGFPNVGKSAIINRLLGRRMAKSKNLPGVTRSLQWVRLGGNNMEGPAAQSQEDSIELLDSPGIIPAKQLDWNNALLLAICNDIGEASYDRVVVAAALCDRINFIHQQKPKYVDMRLIKERYMFDFPAMTGEQIVYEVAERLYNGNMVSAADRLLGDFRRGLLGKMALEIPTQVQAGSGSAVSSPVVIEHELDYSTDDEDFPDSGESEHSEEPEYLTDPANANAVTTRPSVTKVPTTVTVPSKSKEKPINLDVGRGNYDGW